MSRAPVGPAAVPRAGERHTEDNPHVLVCAVWHSRTACVRLGGGAPSRHLDREAANIPHYSRDGGVKLSQFNAGQSNPTYLVAHVDEGGQQVRCKYVLRKRPALVKVSTAHAVDREFRGTCYLHM